MGLGLSIKVTEAKWPKEGVPLICDQCGSGLLLTRWGRLPGVPVPGGESEQYCPQCGAAACEEEPQSQNKQRVDFFSRFKK